MLSQWRQQLTITSNEFVAVCPRECVPCEKVEEKSIHGRIGSMSSEASEFQFC
jgi:hypothetical protein